MALADFKNTFLQNLILSRVSRKPTHRYLSPPFTQVKENTALGLTTLRRGKHVHLGLTAAIFMSTRQNHNQKQKLFNNVNLLEQALIQQVKETINANLFESETDINTKLVSRKTHKIVTSIFAHYSCVTLAKVKQEQTKVNMMVYDTSLPVNTIFNTI